MTIKKLIEICLLSEKKGIVWFLLSFTTQYELIVSCFFQDSGLCLSVQATRPCHQLHQDLFTSHLNSIRICLPLICIVLFSYFGIFKEPLKGLSFTKGLKGFWGGGITWKTLLEVSRSPPLFSGHSLGSYLWSPERRNQCLPLHSPL